MFTQSRFNLLKTAAAALAAASLAACGGGGGSGGGSQQSAGTITVADPVTIDDVITIKFRDCVSKGFNAKLDSIDITPLFTLDKSDNDKACNARASVYALQGVLGEKAQAEGSSKLLVKVQGRTDIDKSFKFKAWPEFALSYPNYNKIKGEVFNALLPANGGVTVSSASGVSSETEKAFEISPVNYPITVSVGAKNGLKNAFRLANGGENIEDSTVFQLPATMNEEHVVSDWVQSYLKARGNNVQSVKITFANSCSENGQLCPTITVDGEDYELIIIKVGTSSGFALEAVEEGASSNPAIVSALQEAVEALGSVLLKNSISESGVENEVQGVTLAAPAFISVERSVKFSPMPASYFAQDVGDIKESLPKEDLFYFATTSSEINQSLLATTLVQRFSSKPNIKGEIPLCEGGDCTLRDELIKLATPAAEEMAKSLGLITTAQARKLLEEILTKKQKIVYKVVLQGAPPYVRFLGQQLELSAYNVFFELSLSEEIKAKTVCGKVFSGLLLTGCNSELPSGTYTLQLGDLALKQRVLVKKQSVEISDLIETSLHVNDYFKVGGKDFPGVALAENESNTKGGGLDKQAILPVLYSILGLLPIDEVSNFKLSDLTHSNSTVEIDCDTPVLSDFIGNGKKLSFNKSELKIGKTTTDSDTKEAKHLILSGDIIKTPDGSTPDVNIVCQQ